MRCVEKPSEELRQKLPIFTRNSRNRPSVLDNCQLSSSTASVSPGNLLPAAGCFHLLQGIRRMPVGNTVHYVSCRRSAGGSVLPNMRQHHGFTSPRPPEHGGTSFAVRSLGYHGKAFSRSPIRQESPNRESQHRHVEALHQSHHFVQSSMAPAATAPKENSSCFVIYHIWPSSAAVRRYTRTSLISMTALSRRFIAGYHAALPRRRASRLDDFGKDHLSQSLH